MFKKLIVILVLLTIALSAIPAYAAPANFEMKVAAGQDIIDEQIPVIYESEIVVTDKGGVYNIGFATIKFPKNFIDSDQLPITINVKIYAINGEAVIEFVPDVPDFNKEVTVMAHTYMGLLSDKATGKNVRVNVRAQKFNVEHFSRYCFS